MRFLTRRRQSEIFKRLHDVVITLAGIDDIKANYALGDMWQIARYVGGREMVEALEGRNYNAAPRAKRIADGLSDSIDLLDEIMEVQK